MKQEPTKRERGVYLSYEEINFLHWCLLYALIRAEEDGNDPYRVKVAFIKEHRQPILKKLMYFSPGSVA